MAKVVIKVCLNSPIVIIARMCFCYQFGRIIQGIEDVHSHAFSHEGACLRLV